MYAEAPDTDIKLVRFPKRIGRLVDYSKQPIDIEPTDLALNTYYGEVAGLDGRTNR